MKKELAGTIPYTAPEQLQGKPCPASDQYSLGIVVYEWLSGDCPFQGGFVEIVSQHLQAVPPPLYGRIPGISSTIESIVFKALAKDPKERFASVTAFTNALAQAMPTVQRPLFKNPLTPPPPDIVLQSTKAMDASISPSAPLSSTSAHVPMNGSSQPASTLTPFGTQQPPMEAVSFWTQSSQPMAPISLPSQPTLNIPTNTRSQSTRILTPSDQSPIQSGTPLTSNPPAIASHSFKPGQFSQMPPPPEFSPEQKPRLRGFISKKALALIALVLVVILGSAGFLYHAATVSKLPGPGTGITQTVGQTASASLNVSTTPTNQSPTPSHPTSAPGAITSTPTTGCMTPTQSPASWQGQGWIEIPPGNTTINSLSATSYNTNLYLFGKGTQDNSIYYTIWCGNISSWSQWRQVPGGTNVIGLSAVTYNSKLYLFRTDTNNSISYTTYNGTWSIWTQIQGMLTPKVPTAVVYSYNNNKTLYLFSIDSSFYIHYITFNGNSLTRWSVIPLAAPNGHACSWPPGSQNAASDSPVAATSYQNELFVFGSYNGDHNVICFYPLNGNSWGLSYELGENTQELAATSDTSTLFLFGIDNVKGQGYDITCSASSSECANDPGHHWQTPPPTPITPVRETIVDPLAVASDSSYYYVFAISNNNQIYVKKAVRT